MKMRLSEVLDRFAGAAVPAEEIARLEAEAERLEKEARKVWETAREKRRINAARKRLASEIRSPQGQMIVDGERIGWLSGGGSIRRTAITLDSDGWAREALGEFWSRHTNTVKQTEPGVWKSDWVTCTEIEIEEDV